VTQHALDPHRVVPHVGPLAAASAAASVSLDVNVSDVHATNAHASKASLTVNQCDRARKKFHEKRIESAAKLGATETKRLAGRGRKAKVIESSFYEMGRALAVLKDPRSEKRKRSAD
jgi:hypothetical protein